MGDRVAVLKDGILQQVDTPTNLYNHPVNAFVAGFIGSPAMNLLDLKFDDAGVVIEGAHIPLPSAALTAAKAEGLSEITVGFRPEDLVEDANGFAVTIDLVEVLGADAYVYGSVKDAGGTERQITVRVDGRNTPAKGSTIKLTPTAGHLHVFSTRTGNRLG
jgi:multiple sugar transport system ATP-binding protein